MTEPSSALFGPDGTQSPVFESAYPDAVLSPQVAYPGASGDEPGGPLQLPAAPDQRAIKDAIAAALREDEPAQPGPPPTPPGPPRPPQAYRQGQRQSPGQHVPTQYPTAPGYQQGQPQRQAAPRQQQQQGRGNLVGCFVVLLILVIVVFSYIMAAID